MRHSLTLFAVLIILLTVPVNISYAADGPVVSTTNGPVQGFDDSGVNAFKGIRYGAPPMGALRFMAPQKPAARTEAAPAIAYGHSAIQMASGQTGDPTNPIAKAIGSVFTVSAETKTNEEDCLFLNVWSPGLGDGKPRPIMVWLHGGGYAYGSGSWPVYDGRNLADKGDVVVVTVNHRLNAFGYLNLADIGGEAYADSGNVGMLDLVLMLEWMRDNAAACGGDAGNVTIFGESGGGAKVSTLLAMPSAQGLFHKAIIESGPGLVGVTKDVATTNAQALLDELDISADNISKLHDTPWQDILAAAFAVQATSLNGRLRLAPVVDGTNLPTDPFTPKAPEMSKDIPILIGSNKDEMTLFTAGEPWFFNLTEEQLFEKAKEAAGDKAEPLLAAFRKAHPDYTPAYLWIDFLTNMHMFYGSVQLAERKADQMAGKFFTYYLTLKTPAFGGMFKSPHTLEMPFVFDNVELSRPVVGPGDEPQRLADQMSDAWLAFAKTGDPNTDSLPDWPPYDSTARSTMVFDLESKIEKDVLGEVRKILAAK